MPVPSKFKDSKGPQQQCFDRADELQHNFFVAKQYAPTDSSKPAANSYRAFKTVHHFLQFYDRISSQSRTFMELIREGRPCLEYYDIEWKLENNPTVTTIAREEQAVLSKLQTLRNEFAPECPVDEIMCRVTSASSISKQKGSLHVVVFQGEHAFHNNHIDMKAFMMAFRDFIKRKESASSDKEGSILKGVDWLVYTRNRLMRCLGSAKFKEPNRPFVRASWHAVSVDSPPHEFFITNVSPILRLINLDHIENVPKNRELVRASLRQSSATLRHKPVSIESGAPFSESTSIRCVVDAALQIFLETKAKHVAMESDDDESEKLKDNDEDEDKDVFDVAKDAPPPVFSISQALSLYNDKNTSNGDQPEDCRKDIVASMASQFKAGSISIASTGMLVTLKRTVPGWCVLCNRIHDNSDAYLTINLLGKVSLGCYRNIDKQLIQLGALSYSKRIAMRDALITSGNNKGFLHHKSYSSKHLKFNAPKSSIIIRSPPGTGKTRYLKKFVKENPQYIFVAVSCRRTLAEHLCKELEFVNYMDAPAGQISSKRIVVQAESLWRLDLAFYNKHQDKIVFILDEFASLVEQFNSKTMSQKKGPVMTIFEQFLRLSHRVIVLDADLTNAHTEILKEYRNDLYIVNNDYEAHAGNVFEFHSSERQLQDRIVDALGKEGKRLWICSTHSAKHTAALHRALNEKGFRGKCMTANTSEPVKRDTIKEISTVLDGDYQYFIHTPTISVGVDFNIPDKVDYVVGFFNTHSGVSVETCHQMLRRARQVKEKKYLIHMKDRFSNLPTTEESVKEWLCNQDQMIRGGATDAQHLSYDGSASFKLTLENTLYAQLYILTKITKNLSKNDFVGRFIQQIKDAGGAVRGIDELDSNSKTSLLGKDIKQFETDIQINENIKIASAPDIGFLQYEELCNRRGSPDEGEFDKYHIRKFYLQKVYNLQDNFEMTAEWVDLYNSKKEITIYQNLCRIQDGIEASMEYEKERDHRILDSIDQDPSKTVQSIDQRAGSKYTPLKYATDMLLICGFKDSFSQDKISRKALESNLDQAWPEIAEKMEMICTTLDIPRPTHNNWKFKYKMLFLQRVMEPVLGLVVKSADTHSREYKIDHRSNVGKRREIELGPVFSFWNE